MNFFHVMYITHYIKNIFKIKKGRDNNDFPTDSYRLYFDVLKLAHHTKFDSVQKTPTLGIFFQGTFSNLLLHMNRLNKTESAIFVSLGSSLLPENLIQNLSHLAKG